MKAGNLYHLEIQNKEDVRRNILSSARLSVSILESHFKLKTLRQDKVRKLTELKKTVERISSNLDKLHKKFPKELPEDTPPWIKEFGKKKPVRRKKKAKPKQPVAEQPIAPVEPEEVTITAAHDPDAEMRALEKTLSLIEERLKKV